PSQDSGWRPHHVPDRPLCVLLFFLRTRMLLLSQKTLSRWRFKLTNLLGDFNGKWFWMQYTHSKSDPQSIRIGQLCRVAIYQGSNIASLVFISPILGSKVF